jgi:two-component system response regulator MtrA
MTTRILLVEDDDALAEGLARQLRRAGFEVERVANGDAALEVALARFDLAILDLMLPGTYGLDVLKRWRAREDGALPVVLLTARDHTADKVRGLSLGADDYVTKPFYPEELVARIHARLRRTGAAAKTDRLRVGPLEIDREARRASVAGEAMDLTPVELAILIHLAERAGRAVARADLASAVLDREDEGSERTLDVHVSRIRKKLGVHETHLATVWGIGYRLDAEARAGRAKKSER